MISKLYHFESKKHLIAFKGAIIFVIEIRLTIFVIGSALLPTLKRVINSNTSTSTKMMKKKKSKGVCALINKVDTTFELVLTKKRL